MNAPRYGRAYWVTFALGAAVMAYGAVGLVGDTGVGASTNVGASPSALRIATDKQ